MEQEEEVISEQDLQQLRSNATHLLLAENWKDYISLYSEFISRLSCSSRSTSPRLQKCLCSALSNRAEAFYRLRHLQEALDDCDRVLEIDSKHRKALLSKGRIFLDLDRYWSASLCFQKALDFGLVDRCLRLEAQSRNGLLDVSDWVVSGYSGDPPDISEYVGPVEIRESRICGGRGLFATKNVGAGTPLVITRAVVIGRGILPEDSVNGSGLEGRLAMWKDFVEKILAEASKSRRTLQLIYSLSTGEEADGEKEAINRIPDMGLFKPEEQRSADNNSTLEKPDANRILKILDLNCLTGDAISATVLGRNTKDYCTVGLWILPSYLNHSCHPNARRLHIGDRVVVHASRDVKAGEELTFAYFDVLQPLQKRKELAKGWGFQCRCERCKFEEKVWTDVGETKSAAEVEEWIGKRWELRAKEKGYLRASFWKEYAGVYRSERLTRRWGRKIPVDVAAVESVVGGVGGDERVLRVAVDGVKRGGGGGNGGRRSGGEVMEKVVKLGRGVYGKVVRRKQAVVALLEANNAGVESRR